MIPAAVSEPSQASLAGKGEVNSRGLTLWAMTLFTVMAFVLSKDQRLGAKKRWGQGKRKKIVHCRPSQELSEVPVRN